jgi:hypothetical protein
MYYTVTLAPKGCTVPISSAHFFDLDSHQVTPTAPIPVEDVTE